MQVHTSSSTGACSCQHHSIDVNAPATTQCESTYEGVISPPSIKSSGAPGSWDDARKALPGVSRGVRMPLLKAKRLCYYFCPW